MKSTLRINHATMRTAVTGTSAQARRGGRPVRRAGRGKRVVVMARTSSPPPPQAPTPASPGPTNGMSARKARQDARDTVVPQSLAQLALDDIDEHATDSIVKSFDFDEGTLCVPAHPHDTHIASRPEHVRRHVMPIAHVRMSLQGRWGRVWLRVVHMDECESYPAKDDRPHVQMHPIPIQMQFRCYAIDTSRSTVAQSQHCDTACQSVDVDVDAPSQRCRARCRSTPANLASRASRTEAILTRAQVRGHEHQLHHHAPGQRRAARALVRLRGRR